MPETQPSNIGTGHAEAGTQIGHFATRWAKVAGRIPSWNGKKLGYIEARHQIYLPLYRDLVKRTDAFVRLKHLYEQETDITLFDFDGYDHRLCGMTLYDVLNNPGRICGHAFILAMMLEYNEDFSPSDLAPVA